MSANNNLNSSPEATIEPFKVFIRIRPLSDKEKIQNEKGIPSAGKGSMKHIHNPHLKNIVVVEDNLLFVLDPDSLDLNGRKEKNFIFDDVFTEKHSNSDIFENVIRGMVENVIKGFNSTAFAYGVTGTGKTHTMFGNMNLLNQEYSYSDNYNFNTDYIEKGVCIYALDYLFDQINMNENKSFTVKISYLEIYNEQVIDLLVSKPTSLMIIEDSVRGVVVPDLSEYIVTNSKELIKFIIEGNTKRTMAATNQNQFSSRSHAILQVVVEQKNKIRDTKEEYIVSKFLIVDLAGSERGGLEKGLRTQEGANINRSLLSLGNCINILSDKSKKGAFVPYRDSKLTRLLKDSLGGNISTIMIACISPSPISYDETVNTLKYASRARTIQKKVTKNIKEVDVHISQYKEIIDSLKGEIDQLKEIIKNQQNIINENMNVPINEDFRAESIDINRSNYNHIQKPSHDQGLISGSQSVPKLAIAKVKQGIINIDKIQEFEKIPKNNVPNLNRNSNHNFMHHNNSSLAINNDPLNNNFLSKSSNNVNKNGNYSNISLISKKSEKHQNFNNNPARTVHNINLDIYKKFLISANNFNVGNIVESLDNVSDKKENNNENNFEFEDLEKQIDNLQNDKILLEEYLENSKIYDKSISEKYQIIKSYFQKYLEIINDKLIENIEQNMILKFNLKEILDLNNTNNQHLSILYSQIIQFEKLKLNPQANEDEINGEILKLKEEMSSIQIAIEENERIKERISDSLNKNLKFKKIFKKILVKLISNTSSKLQDNTKNLNNAKYEQAYKNLIKEKELLENKNMEFKKHLHYITQEKDHKDNKLNEVQRELEILKRCLVEKDIKIEEIKKKNKNLNEYNDKNHQNINYLITNEDGIENVTNTQQTEMENIDINLQDDYFSNRKKIKDIPEFVVNDNFVNKLGEKLIGNNNKDSKIKKKSTLNSNDDSFNNIQNIRYIINQTNNIVNNNINKIISQDKKKNPDNKSININFNISTGKESKDINTNNLHQNYENKKDTQEKRTKSETKRNSTKSTSNVNKRSKRLSTLGSQNSSNLMINNENNYKSKSKSPKNSKLNKLREFDKIIESQLNEVYNKKARELGDKMKKKIGVKTNSSLNKKDPKSSVNNLNNFNMILDKINRVDFRPPINKDLSNQNQIMNRSLSISCVSINNEGDFNSELDIVEHIQQPNQKKDKKYQRPNTNNYSTKNKENTLVFTPKAEEFNNKIAVNFVESNYQNSNYISPLVKHSNHTPTLSSVSGNKNVNVQKFLSNNNINSIHMNNNTNTFISINNNKEKPVLPNKRDYSPNVDLLKQARLEKQLKNQSLSENKEKISNSQISIANNPPINSSSNSHTQNVNKFISKNAVDFVNDYLNNKRILIMAETEKSEDNDIKPTPNFMNTNRTELPKGEALEQALTSLINISNDSDKFSENKIEEKNPLNEIPQSTDDLFKCFNEVIKNPKISKYLDKK